MQIVSLGGLAKILFAASVLLASCREQVSPAKGQHPSKLEELIPDFSVPHTMEATIKQTDDAYGTRIDAWKAYFEGQCGSALSILRIVRSPADSQKPLDLRELAFEIMIDNTGSDEPIEVPDAVLNDSFPILRFTRADEKLNYSGSQGIPEKDAWRTSVRIAPRGSLRVSVDIPRSAPILRDLSAGRYRVEWVAHKDAACSFDVSADGEVYAVDERDPSSAQ